MIFTPLSVRSNIDAKNTASKTVGHPAFGLVADAWNDVVTTAKSAVSPRLALVG